MNDSTTERARDEFERLFPRGTASIFDVLSLLTPDELDEILSDDHLPTKEESQTIRDKVAQRALLVREAEALSEGGDRSER